ncbi:hypothetical protein PFICI_06285 [Pestalotiopsis fici W106-1]|uniref:Ankyrin n=1 Tax=Pestalotiopsis fici (strain W106-1 / CGMCC3.15140) TaxID=1229662 RepID=W3X5A5_PESFW|nr:uncharacterized protein PFICI_06285 [Pestalotiopsis fici W106-1]ETS81283.1 hypothetical protein PFICI_06285 [Pestalotiopsis fici W106-1]
MEPPAESVKVIDKSPNGINSTDQWCKPEYDTPLSAIVRRNDVNALQEYLSEYPYKLKGPGATYDFSGFWPDAFDYAATWGATSVLEFLLDYERQHPEKNFRFRPGDYGLLNISCLHGHLDTVRFLLDQSQDIAADLRFRDADGWTPLLAAAKALGKQGVFTNHCEEIMTLLLNRGAPANDVRQRRFVLHDGEYLDVDRRRRWSEDYATEEEMAEDPMLNRTLPGKVSTHIVDTVLSLAVKRARPAMIRRLIDGGADVHAQLFIPLEGDVGLTPLHIAAGYYNVQAIEVLYEKCGTDFDDMVRKHDSFGRTPLHEAADGQWTLLPKEQVFAQGIATFSFLLPHCSADLVNARDGNDYTALQYIMRVFEGASCVTADQRTLHIHTARQLLKHGADPNVKMADGRSILHVLADLIPIDGKVHEEL